jgi:hypothetical protein
VGTWDWSNPSWVSVSWTPAFDQYLNFPLNDFIEGLWSTVFTTVMNVLELNKARVPLTPQEQAAADNLSNSLVTVLQARASALRSGVLATWIIRFKKWQSQRPFCCVKFPRKSTSSSETAITTRLSYTRPVSMQIAC